MNLQICQVAYFVNSDSKIIIIPHLKSHKHPYIQRSVVNMQTLYLQISES